MTVHLTVHLIELTPPSSVKRSRANPYIMGNKVFNNNTFQDARRDE
jgi:hypothetical protein